MHIGNSPWFLVAQDRIPADGSAILMEWENMFVKSFLASLADYNVDVVTKSVCINETDVPCVPVILSSLREEMSRITT